MCYTKTDFAETIQTQLVETLQDVHTTSSTNIAGGLTKSATIVITNNTTYMHPYLCLLQDGDMQFDTVISSSEKSVQCFINSNGSIYQGSENEALSECYFFLSSFLPFISELLGWASQGTEMYWHDLNLVCVESLPKLYLKQNTRIKCVWTLLLACLCDNSGNWVILIGKRRIEWVPINNNDVNSIYLLCLRNFCVLLNSQW